MHDPQALRTRFAREGERETKRKVEQGVYVREELAAANEWLAECAQQRHRLTTRSSQARLDRVIAWVGRMVLVCMLILAAVQVRAWLT